MDEGKKELVKVKDRIRKEAKKKQLSPNQLKNKKNQESVRKQRLDKGSEAVTSEHSPAKLSSISSL